MLCTSINIDLDQYETLELNQEKPTSPMHMTLTNPKVEVIDTTPSMSTTRFPWKRVCKLFNAEDQLNSKINNTPSKPIEDYFDIFLDIYMSLEETNMFNC